MLCIVVGFRGRLPGSCVRFQCMFNANGKDCCSTALYPSKKNKTKSFCHDSWIRDFHQPCPVDACAVYSSVRQPRVRRYCWRLVVYCRLSTACCHRCNIRCRLRNIVNVNNRRFIIRTALTPERIRRHPFITPLMVGILRRENTAT